MGIEQVHAYRFEYLKSEEWKTVRIKAIARDKGECQFCGLEIGATADAHHVFYPSSFWKTKSQHLVTLCRPCHDFIHELLPKSFKSKEEGMEAFKNLRRIATAWRVGRATLCETFNFKDSNNVNECWMCRAEDPDGGLAYFRTDDHPKLQAAKFSQLMCVTCRSLLQFHLECLPSDPFKTIKALRSKKPVDVNSR